MAYAETATTLYETYGPIPLARTFAATDCAPDLAESEMPAYSAAYDSDPSSKRHAACDECRKRKLKCSGEPSGCVRCRKQYLTCHYSAQKQMGRPRKRQKIDDNSEHWTANPAAAAAQPTENGSRETCPTAPTLPPLPAPQQLSLEKARQAASEVPDVDIERTNFENVCNGPISQAIKRSYIQARAKVSSIPRPRGDGGSAIGPTVTSSYSTYGPGTPSAGVDRPGMSPTGIADPTDAALWPNFSDMTMLPMLVQDSHQDLSSFSPSPNFTTSADPSNGFELDIDADRSSLAQLPPTPDCPCLPNLYLTLSTLATLNAFPVSSATVDTLLGAQRTGRGVIYCDVCPQKFQSGSQNVMLSSTLITVLADQWQRVKKATAVELKNGFSTGRLEATSRLSRSDPFAEGNGPTSLDASQNPKFMSVREDLEWRTFAYELVQASVFGGGPVPMPPGSRSCSQTQSSSSRPYTLYDLCSALERRQKQWHGLDPPSDEFPARLTNDLVRGRTAGMTLAELKQCEDEAQTTGDGYVCLRIVRHAKMVMRTLESGPPRVDG